MAGVWSDGAGQTPKAIDIAIESFVARENIVRYKRMLEESHDEAARQVLLRMLADEERRAQELGN